VGEAPAGQPKWEAGLVLGGGWVNDYPGADQNHARSLVAPFLIYRGPVLQIDREGIRSRLLDARDFELDITASAAFSARRSEARKGMPGLDYLFGVGPQLVYKGLRGQWGSPLLRLKLRALASTDFHRADGRGAAVDAQVQWRFRPAADWPGTLSFGIQPIWATSELQRYLYDVPAAHATSLRPAYAARAGYLGTEFSWTLTRRQSDRLSWFATAQAMSLGGAANARSPLLRDKSGFSIGAGLLWTPWQSAARAAD
jgi:outer membrane scaffolding protein for murein synthesis (MipA/OmpV family)